MLYNATLIAMKGFTAPLTLPACLVPACLWLDRVGGKNTGRGGPDPVSLGRPPYTGDGLQSSGAVAHRAVAAAGGIRVIN